MSSRSPPFKAVAAGIIYGAAGGYIMDRAIAAVPIGSSTALSTCFTASCNTGSTISSFANSMTSPAASNGATTTSATKPATAPIICSP